MSMIVPLILEKLRAHLLNACQTSITDNDPTRADVVKIGRYLEEPLTKNIHVAVIGGDPEDPKLQDTILTTDEQRRVAIKYPVRKIGGGQFWFRKGVIQLGCYFIIEQLSEDVAREYAYKALARVMNNLENVRFGDMVDDHGEKALKVFCFGNTFYETGGPPSNWIWRGKVLWNCLTVRR